MEKKARYSDSAEHGVRPYHWIAEPKLARMKRFSFQAATAPGLIVLHTC